MADLRLTNPASLCVMRTTRDEEEFNDRRRTTGRSLRLPCRERKMTSMQENRPSAMAQRVAMRRAAHQPLDDPKVFDALARCFHNRKDGLRVGSLSHVMNARVWDAGQSAEQVPPPDMSGRLVRRKSRAPAT